MKRLKLILLAVSFKDSTLPSLLTDPASPSVDRKEDVNMVGTGVYDDSSIINQIQPLSLQPVQIQASPTQIADTYDPTIGTEAATREWLLSQYNTLASQNASANASAAVGGLTGYTEADRLRNDDFYVQSTPLVAGSISGKVIGTQLITGGANAQLFPHAPLNFERNKLQDAILKAMQPADLSKGKVNDKGEWEEFTTPDAGAFNENMRQVYMDGVEKFQAIADKTPDGQKLLYTKGNPLHNAFKNFNTNMSFVANNAKKVAETASEMDIAARNQDLTLTEETKKNMRDVRLGLDKLINKDGSPNYLIQEKLENAQLGISGSKIAKNISDDFIPKITTDIKVANDIKFNGTGDDYLTAIKTIQKKYGLDGDEYFQLKGIDPEKATQKEIDAALRYQANKLVTPYALESWSEMNDPSSLSKQGQVVVKNAEDIIYQQMKQLQTDIKLQTAGNQPPVTRVTVNNLPEVHKETPGFMSGILDGIITNGTNSIGQAGGSQTGFAVLPSGELMVYGKNATGQMQGAIEKYNMDDAPSALSGMLNASRRNGVNNKDANVAQDYINNMATSSEAQGWAEQFKKAIPSVTFQQYTASKAVDRDGQVQPKKNSLEVYSGYMGANKGKVSLPINNDIAKDFVMQTITPALAKQHPELKEFTGKDNGYKFIQFKGINGDEWFPGKVSKDGKGDIVSTSFLGSNTSTGSQLPTENIKGAFGIQDKQGRIRVYMPIGNRVQEISNFSNVLLQNTMNQYFIPRDYGNTSATPTTTNKYVNTDGSKTQAVANQPKPQDNTYPYFPKGGGFAKFVTKVNSYSDMSKDKSKTYEWDNRLWEYNPTTDKWEWESK